jgi:hypothetical protein
VLHKHCEIQGEDILSGVVDFIAGSSGVDKKIVTRSIYDYIIVFKDMKDGSFKKATKKDIVGILAGRYHYYTGGNISWSGRINDPDGGAWTGKCGRYYGNNQKLMNELKELIILDEKNANELRKKESQLIKKGVGIQPKYAYKGGKDPHTKKPYTAKEIKALDDYYKKSEKFRKTDKEYIEFEKNKLASYHVQWDKMSKIREKIAEEDAQNFLDDNKGKFIFIISYSDRDSAQGCTMEHGNIFRNVPYVRISQH